MNPFDDTRLHHRRIMVPSKKEYYNRASLPGRTLQSASIRIWMVRVRANRWIRDRDVENVRIWNRADTVPSFKLIPPIGTISVAGGRKMVGVLRPVLNEVGYNPEDGRGYVCTVSCEVYTVDSKTGRHCGSVFVRFQQPFRACQTS